jgi:hypothetical protein
MLDEAMREQSFVILIPAANVIKTLQPLFANIFNKPRVFIPGNPFQPNLLFLRHVEAYLSGAPFT